MSRLHPALAIVTLSYLGGAAAAHAAPTHIYVLSSQRGSKVTTYSMDGSPTTPTIALGGSSCDGLAVDVNGKIYVANNGPRDNVMVFLPDGTRTTPTLNLAISAFGVTVDDSGTMFVVGSNSGKGMVKSFSAAGVPTGLAIPTGLDLATGIARDFDGRIYVTSKNNDMVKTYDKNGQPTTPTLRAGINTPSAVAVAGGKIYVANYVSVGVFQPDGQKTTPTFAYNGTSDGGPATPSALAIDSDGKIYVGYYSVGHGHGAVVIYRPDGKLFGPVVSVPEGVMGVAVH